MKSVERLIGLVAIVAAITAVVTISSSPQTTDDTSGDTQQKEHIEAAKAPRQATSSTGSETGVRSPQPVERPSATSATPHRVNVTDTRRPAETDQAATLATKPKAPRPTKPNPMPANERVKQAVQAAPQLPEQEDETLDGVDESDASDTMIWTVDRDGILGAMAEAAPKLTECYGAWSKDNKQLGGNILVSYTIEADANGDGMGKIVDVKLPENTVNHRFLKAASSISSGGSSGRHQRSPSR